MKSPAIIISLALAAGLAIAVIIQHDFETPDLNTATLAANTPIEPADQNIAKSRDTDRVAEDVNQLSRLLQNEIRARQALEQRFEALSRQVSDINSNRQSFEVTNELEQVENIAESDVSGANNKWFNEQALIDGGMASSQASELKYYFEQLEMERLYLRDQSIREKWSSEKLREAMQALESKEDELKNQLSETAYDAYLYASGRPNRVAVTSVLENAQAGLTGIKSGDHIIRYDNQRIYNWLDLREATASGNISDMVELQVERDDKMIQFYLTRGPLGIRMNSVSVAPRI